MILFQKKEDITRVEVARAMAPGITEGWHGPKGMNV